MSSANVARTTRSMSSRPRRPANNSVTASAADVTTAKSRKRKAVTDYDPELEPPQIPLVDRVSVDKEPEHDQTAPSVAVTGTASTSSSTSIFTTVPTIPRCAESLAEKRQRLGILSFRDHLIDIEFTHGYAIVLTLRFLVSQNSLYDVAASFFHHYMSKKLKGQQINSNRWTLNVYTKSENVEFDSFVHSPDSLNSSEVNIHPLANFLELNIGDTMVMRYNFKNTVVDMRISAMALATEEDKNATTIYPIVVNKGHKKFKPKGSVRGAIADASSSSSSSRKNSGGGTNSLDEFLSEEERALSLEARAHFEQQPKKMEWSQRQQKYIPEQKPNWSQSEEESMCFLIYANVPFTKAWNQYFQYCILSRSRAATSSKWYDEKKIIAEMDSYHRTSRWLFYGDQYTEEECLPRALKLLSSIRAKNLKVYTADIKS